MKHFYRDVKGLGNVAVSRHAQARMEDEGISQELFDRVLLEPSQPDIPDGMDVLWREGEGLRIVILTNPTPNRGAKLVKTAYIVKPQARVPVLIGVGHGGEEATDQGGAGSGRPARRVQDRACQPAASRRGDEGSHCPRDRGEQGP